MNDYELNTFVLSNRCALMRRMATAILILLI